MYGSKIKLLDELIDHLGDSQGSDLKSLLDESKKPKEMMMPDEDPKGLKIESVELMGKKPDFNDMANDAIADASTISSSPRIDPEKAKQMEKGAMESGWQPDKWKKNLKEGLGLSAMNEGGDELSDDELKELLGLYG